MIPPFAGEVLSLPTPLPRCYAAAMINLLLVAVALAAQDPVKGTTPREFKASDGGTLKYRYAAPDAAGKKIPLVLFLHGAGERGDDNRKQVVHGIREFLKRMEKNPCHLVVPQCPTGGWWSSRGGKTSGAMAQALELVDSLVKAGGVDEKRIYVTGLSMGGYGTWSALVERPKFFAAGVPICGGGDPSKAGVIAKIPQWVFHGDADKAVNVDKSRTMVAALKKAGGEPKYTEYPGVGHDSWVNAYAEARLTGRAGQTPSSSSSAFLRIFPWVSTPATPPSRTRIAWGDWWITFNRSATASETSRWARRSSST